VVCRNPGLAAERGRKREELLAATETDLAAIKVRVERKRNRLRGTAEIALAVGEVFNTHKMRKHFDLTITDDAFSYARKAAEITAEAATDGLYVVRTNLSEATLGDADTVRSYKSLALVERAFRCIKTADLNVRSAYYWLEGYVRAHVFLCMLAYYLEWHMRQCLAPMLFDDTDKEAAEALRSSVVAPAQRSKSRNQEADDGHDTGWTAGAQLSHAAGRSGDVGTQYHHHRDQSDLSAHRGDAADAGAAEDVRSAVARSVASSGRLKRHFILCRQWFM
jgi:hypothetical protein